jgi:hypothetical protein
MGNETMEALITLCSAGQHSARSYSDRFAIVSDENGELIAIFSCPDAMMLADALVALPELLEAVERALTPGAC